MPEPTTAELIAEAESEAAQLRANWADYSTEAAERFAGCMERLASRLRAEVERREKAEAMLLDLITETGRAVETLRALSSEGAKEP